MTNNRLEEIRARQSSRRETLYGADIEYLLSLLDARPAVAETCTRCAGSGFEVDGVTPCDRCDKNAQTPER